MAQALRGRGLKFSPGRVRRLRSGPLFAVCAAILLSASGAVLAEARLVRDHRGVSLIAVPPRPDTPTDVRILDGAAAQRKLAAAYDLLALRSPTVRRAIERLKADGLVLLYYLPWDLAATSVGSSPAEVVAQFLPHLPDNYGLTTGKRRYLVAVGRLGINWPVNELAAVLAHELAGHGVQLLDGRIGTTRHLDLECDAMLVQEQAKQDLALDKSSGDLVEFRQIMERHFCRDFRAWQKDTRPATVALWDARNPDVPRLRSLFGRYLGELRRKGVTGEALAAAKNQRTEDLAAVYATGKPHAIFQTARRLWDGIGIAADRAEAIRWFVRAATLGHVGAREAIVAAAETGNAAAQSNLGVLYEKEGNLPQAALWYRVAADKGDSHARNNLGDLYRTGRGVARDPAKALHWFNLSAAQGNDVAMFHLGAMAEAGEGREKDIGEAAAWFRRAAEAGNRGAQYRLGRLYFLGRLGSRDLPKAVASYRKAAEAGYGPAQNMMGWLHMHGKGVERDYVKARILLGHAAAQGNERACFNLGMLYRQGLGVTRDFSWARRWFRRSADRGYAPAMVRLGEIYAGGTGVEKDLVQAYAWYRIAEIRKARGSAKARALLEQRLTDEQRAAGEKRALAWKPASRR